MKAAVLKSPGKIDDLTKNLVIEDAPLPQLRNDEVLVKVRYAALNHRDLWITEGLYSKIQLPVILGSDCCGIVEECPDGSFSKGDEVIINPGLNWGKNENYQGKDFKILGMPDNGTLAEYVKVNKNNVYPKPPHLSPEEAAALPLGGATAYRACIIKAAITENDAALITGAGGGVAAIAMQMAVAAGAKVYVTSGDDEKINKAVALGAVSGVNYKQKDWEKDILQTAGSFNVIIDSAGGDEFSKYLSIADYGARIVIYGATLGTVKDFDVRKVFWKQLRISGSTMGSDKDFENMLHFISEKKIKPVIDEVFDLDNIHGAFKKMQSGDHFGKIVVNIQ